MVRGLGPRDLLRGRHFEIRGARELRVDAIAAAALERFASRLVADLTSGCVIWRGATNGDGYGVVRLSRTPSVLVLAHRLAVALEDGICPGDRVVDHRCGERRCCRRDHLELTTPELNTPGIYGLADPADLERDRAELRAGEIPV